MVFDKMSALGSKIMGVAGDVKDWAFKEDPPLGTQISNYIRLMMDASETREGAIKEIEQRTKLDIRDGALNLEGDLAGSRFVQTTAHAVFTVGALALPLAWPVGLGLFAVGALALAVGVGVGKLEAYQSGGRSPTTLELLGLGTPLYVRCVLFGLPAILVALFQKEKREQEEIREAPKPGGLPPVPWFGFDHVPYLAQHPYLQEGVEASSDTLEIDGKWYRIEQRSWEAPENSELMGTGEEIRLVELDDKGYDSAATKWYLRSESKPNRFWEESALGGWNAVKVKGNFDAPSGPGGGSEE